MSRVKDITVTRASLKLLSDPDGEDPVKVDTKPEKKKSISRDSTVSGDVIEEKEVYKQLIEKLPSLGPLNIVDLNDFLVKSKTDFEQMYHDKSACELQMSDFTPITLLGKGSFSRVILARLKQDESLYAIKCIEKKGVIEKHSLRYISNEKRILQSMNFPFVIYLAFFFVDIKYVYFVLSYVPGGDFHLFLNKHKVLTEDNAKFYVGQLVLAIQYLHYLELIHRDIKPENIIIDALGYLKLADFGQCKRSYGSDRSWTITGTPEYMAPEVIVGRGYDCSADWWSLGVVTYEICAGRRPFSGRDMKQVFTQVLNGRYEFPKSFSTNLKRFVHVLLDSSRKWRKIQDKSEFVKEQPWLKGMEWLSLLNRTIEAPYLPELTYTPETNIRLLNKITKTDILNKN